MILAFYKVDNSKGYDRHTFDILSRNGETKEIKEMLSHLSDEELRIYDMNNKFDRMFWQDDYNDEDLDGG